MLSQQRGNIKNTCTLYVSVLLLLNLFLNASNIVAVKQLRKVIFLFSKKFKSPRVALALERFTPTSCSADILPDRI